MSSRRSKAENIITLPVLPLRDVVIFPNMIFPVLVGRESSLKAATEALNQDKEILLVTQQNPEVDEPFEDDVYRSGTIAKIAQMLRLPNGLMRILVEGESQAVIREIAFNGEYMEAAVAVVKPTVPADNKMKALQRQVAYLFQEYIRLHQEMPPEMLATFDSIDDPIRRLYFVAGNLGNSTESKQRILEATEAKEQYMELVKLLNEEIEILKLEQEIDSKVQDTIQKSQRQFIIQEQIRALQNELEEEVGEVSPELAKLRDSIEKAKMPKEVETKAYEELDKLRKTPMMSPEFAVNRNYLEWVTAVPWSKRTRDKLDIDHVKEILDEDHYGLEKPKDRILEHIAVLNLVREMRGQILCFVGPPGVGKTSLGKSIARALGRKFIRVSLGGVRDEAEIRGHRRTYIGSMPGRVIQSMKRAGTINPVMLLDEIDKMSMDFRGDPSSAMLEVLDPEQNIAFNDHYLEVDYDLSHVLFIATANVLHNIPLPLQDRMEIIRLNGYLEHDKLEIAKRHIVPIQLQEHGLGNQSVEFTDEGLLKIIREYTSEAGVRNLEREIAAVCRKVARHLVSQKKTGGVSGKKNETPRNKPNTTLISITPELVEQYLKIPRFRNRASEKEDFVGAATGLAWTPTGGDTLMIEVSIVPGNERLTLTGQLGDVMKESSAAALTYIRANTETLGIPEHFSKEREVHIHVPEGAIPKDGPSAGITMAVALISAASGRPVRSDVAMTGEITLRGRILPIGGLTEKLLAAQRAKMKTVIIPKENEVDLSEIPAKVTDGLEIIPVEFLSEAVPHVFRQGAAKKPEGNGVARSHSKKGSGTRKKPISRKQKVERVS
ncbi:MAG: endopeptidase La [Ignavibacteriae bacterium]|nr:endopeptidase La [Ignavibacteriota bacterium]MCB9214366.1 endopeptidase La [Ignavibacteria bacterium]